MLRAFTQPSNFYQSKNIRWVLRMVLYILAILNFWSMVHSSANKHLHALKKHIWPTSGTLPVSLGCYMDLLSTSIHCILYNGTSSIAHFSLHNSWMSLQRKRKPAMNPSSDGDKIQFQIFFRVVFQQLKKCRIFLAASKMFSASGVWFSQQFEDVFQKLGFTLDNKSQTCLMQEFFSEGIHTNKHPKYPKEKKESFIIP